MRGCEQSLDRLVDPVTTTSRGGAVPTDLCRWWQLQPVPITGTSYLVELPLAKETLRANGAGSDNLVVVSQRGQLITRSSPICQEPEIRYSGHVGLVLLGSCP